MFACQHLGPTMFHMWLTKECSMARVVLIVKGVLLASVQSYAVQNLPQGNFLSRNVQPINRTGPIELIPSDP